jgi:hypothetical protein
MWLNAAEEQEFFKMFDIQGSELPKVVILNPGKRKRFLTHASDINSE